LQLAQLTIDQYGHTSGRFRAEASGHSWRRHITQPTDIYDLHADARPPVIQSNFGEC
jgi:hypothetical protein